MNVKTYPENLKMNDEQIKQVARFICDNIEDVHKYIDENREDYENWLKEKNKKDNISKSNSDKN